MVPLVKEASAILEARLGAIVNIGERRRTLGDIRAIPVFSTDDVTNTLSALVKESPTTWSKREKHARHFSCDISAVLAKPCRQRSEYPKTSAHIC